MCFLFGFTKLTRSKHIKIQLVLEDKDSGHRKLITTHFEEIKRVETTFTPAIATFEEK